MLQKLLADEIKLREKKNLAQARSFRDLLEATLQKYHNRLIDAAAVIRAMIQIRGEMEKADDRAEQLGLSPEELAFYDAVAQNYETLYDEVFLRDLIHDVVQSIKRNLRVDWTAEHRSDVQAAIKSAVKRTLRTRGVKPDDFETMILYIMKQAEALYGNWPVVAA